MSQSPQNLPPFLSINQNGQIVRVLEQSNPRGVLPPLTFNQLNAARPHLVSWFDSNAGVQRPEYTQNFQIQGANSQVNRKLDQMLQKYEHLDYINRQIGRLQEQVNVLQNLAKQAEPHRKILLQRDNKNSITAREAQKMYDKTVDIALNTIYHDVPRDKLSLNLNLRNDPLTDSSHSTRFFTNAIDYTNRQLHHFNQEVYHQKSEIFKLQGRTENGR